MSDEADYMRDPIPPGHGEGDAETVRHPADPIPVCPACGGAMRRVAVPEVLTGGRHIRNFRGRLRCDIHGVVVPDFVYPEEEE